MRTRPDSTYTAAVTCARHVGQRLSVVFNSAAPPGRENARATSSAPSLRSGRARASRRDSRLAAGRAASARTATGKGLAMESSSHECRAAGVDRAARTAEARALVVEEALELPRREFAIGARLGAPVHVDDLRGHALRHQL